MSAAIDGDEGPRGGYQRKREALPDHFSLTDNDLLAGWEESTSASSASPHVPASRLRSFLAALRLKLDQASPSPRP